MKITNKLIPQQAFLSKREEIKDRIKKEDYLIMTSHSNPDLVLVSIPFFEKLMDYYEKEGGEK